MALSSSESTAPESEGRLTHCPTCGMKIARDDLSLCSYCGSPVALGEERARINATQKRLGKMPEHKNFDAAMDWQPPESEAFVAGMNDKSRGVLMLTLGALFLVFGVVRMAVGAGGLILLALAALLVLGGIWLWLRGGRRCDEATRMPLLKRAALVHERRSETDFEGLGGKTVYYFKLEFADGGEGEFRQPGRGAQFEPLVNGNTGIAYTRGQELLGFKVLKV